jgi:peroxiredoxin
MLELGSPLPDFALPDVADGAMRKAADFRGQALVVAFICNHCPYVKRIASGLAEFSTDYLDADISIVGIASNDPDAYPDDAPERLARTAAELGYRFPTLFDEDQSVARAFSAACTPDFFVYDQLRNLVYRGQFDGARPSNDVPVSGSDVRAAVDAVLSGAPVASDQRPSLGCSIKWKSGNEPN